MARCREIRARIEADRLAQEEAKAVSNQPGERGVLDAEEKAKLEEAKIKAEVRAKAEAEEKAKAEEAARALEEAVANAKAKIMAEDLMKSSRSERVSPNEDSKQTEPKEEPKNVTLSKSVPSPKATDLKSSSKSSDDEASRVEEKQHRDLRKAQLATKVNDKAKSSRQDDEKRTTEPRPKPVTAVKTKKCGSAADTFNLLDAVKKAPKTASDGDKEELTMAELARIYKDVDRIPNEEIPPASVEKQEEVTMADLVTALKDVENPPEKPPSPVTFKSKEAKPSKDKVSLSAKQSFATRVEETRKRALLASIKSISRARDAGTFLGRGNRDSERRQNSWQLKRRIDPRALTLQGERSILRIGSKKRARCCCVRCFEEGRKATLFWH